MKRAIITGATGSVGTALIQDLIENNIEVLVFCRERSKRNNHIPLHPLVQKKYCSLDQLAIVENDTGKDYDIFYHFAWDGTTGAARNDMYLQNQNVRYALDAVGAASRFGCYTFIGAGSQAEYGRVEGLLKPDTPAFPEMGYGIGKLCAGQMTREHAHQLGLKHIWVRILSVYGPNDGGQSMVMSTINKLKEGQIPRFTKGEQMWDYLYSGDAAKAFRLVGEQGIDGKTYVLGSGNAKPLAEYIQEIRDVVAPCSEIALGAIPYAARQVMHLQADISELEKDVGFDSQMPFASGIKYTIDWSNRV
ncbi:NAD(P)-dependent oxidoreductase [Desulfosporosinus sp. BG]|uniref:NAD-dependent epimerase/dehydratase family protein n=1 Tax=Desulfosporosinus sp. BG TaxID=1633135 RepID=UPI00083A0AFC|nr:NAD(P)-dependent oxidoreductase [Desulfosporosinus sp. BG]ODA39140.1 UDP-glucose 4-epimerase [Desulfosporosinus sp. BG]